MSGGAHSDDSLSTGEDLDGSEGSLTGDESILSSHSNHELGHAPRPATARERPRTRDMDAAMTTMPQRPSTARPSHIRVGPFRPDTMEFPSTSVATRPPARSHQIPQPPLVIPKVRRSAASPYAQPQTRRSPVRRSARGGGSGVGAGTLTTTTRSGRESLPNEYYVDVEAVLREGDAPRDRAEQDGGTADIEGSVRLAQQVAQANGGQSDTRASVDMLVETLGRVQERLAAKDNEIMQLTLELNATRREKNQLSVELVQERKRAQHFKKKLRRTQEKLNDEKESIERAAQVQLADAEARLRASQEKLRGALEQARAKTKLLSDRERVHVAEVSGLRGQAEQSADLARRLKGTQHELSKKETLIQSMQSRNSSTLAQVADEQRAALEAAANRAVKAEADAKHHERVSRDLQQQVEQLSMEMMEIKAQIAKRNEWKHKHSELRVELDRKESHLQAALLKLNKLKAENVELGMRLQEANQTATGSFSPRRGSPSPVR